MIKLVLLVVAIAIFGIDFITVLINQLSSLVRQAKTREQGFKRIHSTKRIKK